jgi:hypothetical protein
MSNSGITLVDVRNEAFEAIKLIKAGKMDVKTAGEIRNLLNTVIDTAKTQVEFLKAIPHSIKEKMDQDSIKAIAGTLKDRDAELDQSLNTIKNNENQYQL